MSRNKKKQQSQEIQPQSVEPQDMEQAVAEAMKNKIEQELSEKAEEKLLEEEQAMLELVATDEPKKFVGNFSLVLGILLFLVLGMGIFEFVYFTNKLDAADKKQESLNAMLEKSQAEIDTLSEQIAGYEAGILEYDDFFASASILHMNGGVTDVKIFHDFGDNPLVIACDNDSVVTCEWGESKGNVATLNITAKEKGVATVSISNTLNDEILHIYVYVD